MFAFTNNPWRVGSRLGRTIYEQQGDRPSAEDTFLGIMETREIAEYVVDLHNQNLGNKAIAQT